MPRIVSRETLKPMITIQTEEILAELAPLDTVQAYLDEVWNANGKFNLFSRQLNQSDLQVIVAESLLPIKLGWITAESGPLLDIGSGWGIPSIPLAMACPGLEITLVERSLKKAGFLSFLLNRLGIKASVINGELRGLDSALTFQLITLRRVAFDKRIISDIRSRLASHGTVISFGPHCPPDLPVPLQVVSYTIDGLSSRQLFRITDF
jgi:16S rRNA (guanine527-N7)-methyltransferase